MKLQVNTTDIVTLASHFYNTKDRLFSNEDWQCTIEPEYYEKFKQFKIFVDDALKLSTLLLTVTLMIIDSTYTGLPDELDS